MAVLNGLLAACKRSHCANVIVSLWKRALFCVIH